MLIPKLNTKRSWWLAAAVVLVLALLPLVLTPYWTRILTSMFMYAAVAQGLNVIVGFAGYHAFGNVAWFGVGAYVTGLTISMGVPLPLALVLGVVGASALAFLIGWPLLRLTGHYFAIATVALNLAIVEVILNLGDFTGGASGVNLPMNESISPAKLYGFIYYAMLGAAVIATGVIAWLGQSRLGFALRALKDSEAGAQVMGVNTTLAKMTAWALSAAITALAGGIWAYWLTFIEPGTAFDIGISVKAYIMMLMGGMGTVAGPIIGAFFLEFVSIVIWGQFLKVHLLVLGLLIIVVVMFMPNGLMSYVAALRAKGEGRAS